MYDVIIVGAGPAGLFAAYELSKTDKKVLLIEKGKAIKDRPRSEVMCGVGGAGTFSDGKLHFSPVLSHEKMFHIWGVDEYQEVVNYVDQTFVDFGDNSEYYPKGDGKFEKLVETCKKNGIHLVHRKNRHVGTDKLPIIIGKFEESLRENGIEIMTESTANDIIVENNEIKGVICNGENILAKQVILSPGRFNASWMQNLAKKYSIPYKYDKVEVGVRVEFPSGIMREIAEIQYDSIFLIQTPTYDNVMRTFCVCPCGFVGAEDYEGFVCVNGHSNSHHDSENSNFAFVQEISLTEPLENTTKYAKSIAKLTNTIGGGKPLIQRYADLKNGRRSTWERIKKSHVTPSLKDVVPGDIAMGFPHRLVTNIKEGLEILDKVMPGIASGDTLLYAPEIKLRSSKIETDKHLRTFIKGLSVAGDGAGVSGNIIGAAVTGVIAARGLDL
jgi:uncharacterized protein